MTDTATTTPTPRHYTTLQSHMDLLPLERQEIVLARVRLISLSIELKKLRKSANLKRSELADKMGVLKSTVSAIERGDEVPLSLIQNYIQSLGGELSITAKMSDSEITLL